MPSVPVMYAATPPSPFLSRDDRHLNASEITSSDETFERDDSTSSSLIINGLPKSPNLTKGLARRPPLPPHSNQHRRPFVRGHVVSNSNLTTRSPSPCSVSSSSASYRAKSLFAGMRSPSVASSRGRSLESPTFFSTPPRRTYPRESSRTPPTTGDNAPIKEQAPVVFDASLNFVLGCERQRVRQSFRPTASHLEPSTASSYLSSKISQFLKRTDHIMDEWRSLGHKDEAGDDDAISLPLFTRDKPRGVIGRSQSATNIMIRGFQYYSRSNSVARSPSRRSLSRASEDATLSEGMQEVTQRGELSGERNTTVSPIENRSQSLCNNYDN